MNRYAKRERQITKRGSGRIDSKYAQSYMETSDEDLHEKACGGYSDDDVACCSSMRPVVSSSLAKPPPSARQFPLTNRHMIIRQSASYECRNTLPDLETTYLDKQLICTIRRPFSIPANLTDITIHRKFNSVASYNWYGDKENPVLVVPGMARRYDTKWKGGKLRLDSDRMFIDENHFMMDKYSLDSFFYAIKFCSEMAKKSFVYQEHDIAIDVRCLEKLYDFVLNEPSQRSSFRLETEKAGNVVMFSLCDSDELDQLKKDKTCGLEFAVRCTEVPNDEYFVRSFYKINAMKFFSLNLLVGSFVDCAEFEGKIDGYCEEAISNISKSKLKILRRGCSIKYSNTALISAKKSKGFPYHKYTSWFFADVRAVVVGFHNNGYVPGRNVFPFERVTKLYCQRFELSPLVHSSWRQLWSLLMKIIDFVRVRDEGKKFLLSFEEHIGDGIRVLELATTIDESCISHDVRRFISPD